MLVQTVFYWFGFLMVAGPLVRHTIYPLQPERHPVSAFVPMLFLFVMALFCVVAPATLEGILIQGDLGTKSHDPTFCRVTYYLRLRDSVERSLIMFSVGVVAITLTVGSWRKVLLVADPGTNSSRPVELVIMVGMFGSLGLGLLYTPVHASLLAFGQRLRDELLPDIATIRTDMKAWRKERKGLEELLHVESTTIGSMKGALAILAPLLTSIVTSMLGGTH
jgi:hypothetical protein